MKQSRSKKLEERGQGGLGFRVEEMTRVPDSDWQPPDLDDLPDKLVGEIGVDTETCDYGLAARRGPGWAWRGGGFVAGYSVCADNFRGYLPIAHAEGGNLDPGRVRRWLNHVLSDEKQPKVFANAMYDLGWARSDGVEIKGPIVDVQWVEALLDEYRMEYSLQAIARDRLGSGKDEEMLRRAAAAYGVDAKEDLWRLPAKYAGAYAEEDASLPREIFKAQRPLVEREGLERVFELEHALLPLYMDMRRRGIRIDADYVEQLKGRLDDEVAALQAELNRRVGSRVSVWEARSVAKALEAEGIHCTKTRTGEPSVTKPFLQRIDHWLARAVVELREREKLISTFVVGQLLNQLHGGRVHGQIHPLKSDDGGTVTGRISMSDPNLQFIPVRTALGQEIRRCFLPEEGEQWAPLDFNQQEVRLLVHYAVLTKMPGAAEARDRYLKDPSTNYHEFAAELTQLVYKAAKILNFAIIYGRGVKQTAEELGKSYEETKEMFEKHHRGMPFARALSDRCQALVQRRGYLRSLSGRRMRFNLWEPARWDDRDGRMLPIEAARQAWPNWRLIRARLHKALNSVVQPAAADQTKEAMLAVAREGLGKHVLVQVHDELGCSVPNRETAEKIAGLMRDAVKLEVPSKVDVELGPNWRDAA